VLNFRSECYKGKKVSFNWIVLLRTCFFLCASVILSGCVPAGPVLPVGTTTIERAEKALGIEILGLRLTAAGHMLDFRFRVVEPEKAMPLFRKEIKPYLTDQASGLSLTVPVPAKVGPMRPTSGNPETGRSYFIFFGNPGRFVKAENLVTVVVGDHRIEDLIVE